MFHETIINLSASRRDKYIEMQEGPLEGLQCNVDKDIIEQSNNFPSSIYREYLNLNIPFDLILIPLSTPGLVKLMNRGYLVEA